MIFPKNKSNFFQKLNRIFVRYWPAGLFSLATAVFFIIFINHDNQFVYMKFAVIGFFLTFVSLAISMFYLQQKKTFWHHLAHLSVLIVAGLGLFAHLTIDTAYKSGYLILMTGCFVAALTLFLPFYKNSRNLDFINWLKHLLVDFAVATVFSLIVFAGTAIFYAILKNLFVIDIPESVYAYSVSLIFTVIGFWIFVYLLPEDLENISFYEIPDRFLHLLAAYVLLPFSVIYTITLYIYSLKIIFTNVWPQNQVAVFVGSLFVILFVVYFLIQSSESKIFRKLRYYWRFYFVICLPLLIMYFMAIGIRIKQYGLTEDRCLTVFLGIVCLFAGSYLAIDKFVRLKYIPMVVGGLLLLMSFGPWSIFNVTKHSQIDRYAEFLSANQYVIDGRINESKRINRFDASYRELRQKTLYLFDRYGAESVAQFFPNQDFLPNGAGMIDEISDFYID